MKRLIGTFVGLFFTIFVSNTPVLAYYTNMSASVVVGQPDFASTSINQGRGGEATNNAGANTFNAVNGAIVVNNKLIISDYDNNRVLIWNSIPSSNNAPADVVIGQTNFSNNSVNQGGPCNANTVRRVGVPFSDGTRLFVPDELNHRVLVFNNIPTTNGVSADVVIGQQNFTSCSANQGGSVGASTMNIPSAGWIDGNKVFIVDTFNHRVLVFNNIPTTNGVSADVVIGQQNFLSSSANQGGSPQANTINKPVAMMVKDGRVFVVEEGNNRVTIFNSIPASNNASADLVIGQPNFTSSSANQGGSVGANTLNTPEGIWVSNNRLFITEEGVSGANNRVLIFNSIPASNNASADLVIGQPNFTSTSINQGGSPSANTLNRPVGSYADTGRLIVVDRINHRVLIFNNVIATPEISMTGISKTNDFKMKFSGNVKMGESLHYDLGLGGGISVSVNGNDGAGVNSVGNSVNDGNGSLYYDFSNTFDPWTGSNGTKDDWTANFDSLRSTRGFSVKVTSKNSNTDSSHIFYFEPFNMVSLTPGTTTFTVNKYQIPRIKDNIDHFEIETKKDTESIWKPYLTNISTTNINTTTGIVTGVPSNTLPAGNYQVRAVSVSKDSNWRQNSNTISLNLTSIIPAVTYINPGNYTQTVGQWFPLQLNSLTPNINGISFSNTTVAVRVTNQTTGVYKDYYTVTDRSSHFLFPPVVYGNSLLTISTYDTNGRYTTLPPIRVGM